MEDTLDIYERPYDLRFPVVNMDEASRQLIEETRPSFVNRHGIRCTDYEYIRHGTRDIFMATEPLGNWRTAIVTEHHTMTDWARFMRDHVIARYPDAEKIIIVMDNLATNYGMRSPPGQYKETNKAERLTGASPRKMPGIS